MDAYYFKQRAVNFKKMSRVKHLKESAETSEGNGFCICPKCFHLVFDELLAGICPCCHYKFCPSYTIKKRNK